MMVRVRVHAGAKRETQITIAENKMQISVQEPAADNRANHRVRSLLAAHYQVPLRSVRLVSGHHRASKTFEIQDGIMNI